MLALRPYQQDAIAALDEYLASHPDNPCVVLPTGAGKSLVMAECVRRWRAAWPAFRCVVLAHRKELVEQNAAEFVSQSEGADTPGLAGIWSAALRRRDAAAAVLFASIDSIWRHAGDLQPPDIVIVDEAHRIPPGGEGKYRRFLADLAAINPALRVVGFTATPYRLGCGPVCHPDHILNAVCYEANVADLIAQGYLSPLRSKVSTMQIDTSRAKKAHGDYVISSISAGIDECAASDTVREAMGYLDAEARRAVVWFCADVRHCGLVARALALLGERSRVVTGETAASERDAAVREFRAGLLRHVINANVFTEGFNARNVDAIVLLRPTLSAGLYAQMVGRGLRLSPETGKTDCIVLDYAGCIEEHGPIDCIDPGSVRLLRCGHCAEAYSRAVRRCPHCGWEPPKEERERSALDTPGEREFQRRQAADRAILGGEPETLPVDAVFVSRHCKEGSPDSLRVTYRSGIRAVSEWVCLDHPGFAGEKARVWWRRRFPSDATAPTVDAALSDLFLAERIHRVTAAIVVRERGRFVDVISHDLRKPDGL